MQQSTQASKQLLETFAKEAFAAADLACASFTGGAALPEVVEAVSETRAIAAQAAACPAGTAKTLGDLNWRMHLVCAALYLNLQKVERSKRKRLSCVKTAYQTMMFHFSRGQMELFPPPPAQFLAELPKHAALLGGLAQRELARLSAHAPQRLQALADTTGVLTAEFSAPLGKKGGGDWPARFMALSAALEQAAAAIGEAADPLLYLAGEYRFFAGKIGEVLSLG